VVSAAFGLVWAVYLGGFLTFASGLVAVLSMRPTAFQRAEAQENPTREPRRDAGAPVRAVQ
jgi:hypothetical protein